MRPPATAGQLSRGGFLKSLKLLVPQPCRVCRAEFVANTPIAKTCGKPECKRRLKQDTQNKLRRKVSSRKKLWRE